MTTFDPSARPCDASNVGAVLSSYMEEHNLTQGQLAARLGYDRTWLTRVLSGKRQVRKVGQLREIARTLDIPSERFGLFADDTTEAADANGREPSGPEVDHWRRVRQTLNHRRPLLTKLAADLYPEALRVQGTPLITTRDWLLEHPAGLSAVRLHWTADAAPPQVTGAEPESDRCRPTGPHGARYPRYSRAIRDLDRPVLFENRVSYRLLDVQYDGTVIRQEYGPTTYFDMVDVCEAAAHELAATWLSRGKVSWNDLPFRRLIGDPFNLARRPLLPSVDTLTIRYDRRGQSSFMLHRRNAGNVAIAGGMAHVMPAGVFQPSGLAPWNVSADFDVWRNIMRELSEEFLDNPEHDGSGSPVDYETEEPFKSLEAGRRDGSITVWSAGLALDPLTLAGEILTILVIDADVFDDIFAGLVSCNSEGDVLPGTEGSVGVPWRRDSVFQLLAEQPLAPAASGLIEYAWKHQDLFLPSGTL
jgi:transcriptional regulator with XRE-family HTH domain